jgi:2-dehydro-3-deoxygluconokinase
MIDCLALGEVMLRFDPGDSRLTETTTFRVWEGGGEYNVARGLCRCFGHRTAIVTALVDNGVGRLIHNRIVAGGVDPHLIRWLPDDGIGESCRNGIYFLERGFGLRPPLGVSDRGHSAISQLHPGTVDWEKLFTENRVRWFHTGGIMAGLSPHAPAVIAEAMQAARRCRVRSPTTSITAPHSGNVSGERRGRKRSTPPFSPWSMSFSGSNPWRLCPRISIPLLFTRP